MILAITGTPGTGKTSIAEHLTRNGYETVPLNRILEEHCLMSEYDQSSDSFIIDSERLAAIVLNHTSLMIIEGHLSHFLNCDLIIVLRCNPSVIGMRLVERGYSDYKVSENVEAELIDSILVEALESGLPTYEIDCTHKTVEGVSEAVIQIINGDGDDYLPGKVNWLEDIGHGDR